MATAGLIAKQIQFTSTTFNNMHTTATALTLTTILQVYF